MKKRLLSALCTLLCLFGVSQMASALNPYAYGLKASAPDENGIVTVNYSLNDNNDGTCKVVINFYKGETYVLGVSGTNNVGENTVQVNTADFFDFGEFTWNVTVTGETVAAPTEHSKSYRFYHPAGVAVDRNPASPHYGRIYVTEAMTTTSATYVSHVTGQGLYVFDPLLNPVLNANGEQGYKGGMDITSKFPGITTNSYDPRRIRISNDGRVFISRQTFGVSPVYEVNPDDLNADFTPVFKNFTLDENTQNLLNAEGNFMATSNCGFDLKGEGENLKLLLLSGNKNGISYVQSGYRCDEYNLGTATEWTTIPSKNIDVLSGQYSVNYMGISVAYDNEGGIWYSQYRGTPSDSEPALVHVNAEGVEDYKNTTMVARQAGIAFSPDFKYLAIANAPKKVGIYTITKDEANKPVLNLEYEFATNIGSNCNDIAWDLANNLYIVGNSNEYLKVFALPRESGDVTTPAVGTISVPEPLPEEMYLIGTTAKDYQWIPNDRTNPMTKISAGVFELNDVTIYSSGTYGYIAFTATPGETWAICNSHRYGPAASDTKLAVGDNAICRIADGSYAVDPGTYSFKLDLNTGVLTVTEQKEPVVYPEILYAIGTINGWNPADGSYPIQLVDGSTAKYEGNVPFASGENWLAFGSVLSSNWDVFNANKFGPVADGVELALNTPDMIIKTADNAFKFNATEAFTAKISIDLEAGTILVTKATGTESVEVAAAKIVAGAGEISVVGEAQSIEVYTIGGSLVSTGETTVACPAGIYVVVLDGKATKVVVR